jgi:hypothetical protein
MGEVFSKAVSWVVAGETIESLEEVGRVVAIFKNIGGGL